MSIHTMARASLFIIIAVALNGCVPDTELDSGWRNRDIVVDGLDDDWQGALTYLEDPGIAVGLLNDDEFLYVTLRTSNRAMGMQIVRGGTTLWFDADGGTHKTFGIHFPVGVRQMVVESNSGRPGDVMQTLLEISTARLEILGPNASDRRRLELDAPHGIDVKLTNTGGTLIYELKVPLQRSEGSPYAVGATPGATIGLGLETGEIDRTAMRRNGGRGGRGGGGGRPGGGGGRGGMGGRGGGGRGGMGGRGGPGADRDAFEPLKLWATVHLGRPGSGIGDQGLGAGEELPAR